jgi:hypothetical protein
LDHTVFIVGAGFSLAANRQFVGDAANHGAKYPLIGDLAATCFGRAIPTADIERAFAATVQSGQHDPIDRLVHKIQAADYYVGWQEANAPDSPYHRLLDRFPDAQFISFNYDALLEFVLMKRGVWSPHDGFGVRAEVGTSRRGSGERVAPSSTLVFHLHGTTLLYAVEMEYTTETGDQRSTTWLKPRKEPRFRFDPDALGHCFPQFERAEPGLGYRTPEHRIIAPVPDKARSMGIPFVTAVYNRADALIRSATRIIAVGYRFASCDRQSFDPLLMAAAAARVRVQIVSPDAVQVARDIVNLRAHLTVHPIPASFEHWAGAGFSS